jgi:hypothetical protein
MHVKVCVCAYDVEEWAVFIELDITRRLQEACYVTLQFHVFGLQKMNYILSHTGNVNQMPAIFDMLSNLNCQWHHRKICDD